MTTQLKKTAPKYQAYPFDWTVKGVNGCDVVYVPDLEIDIDAYVSDGEVVWTIEGIGTNGDWLERDTPLYKLIEKAAHESAELELSVCSGFSWKQCSETGFGIAVGAAQ